MHPEHQTERRPRSSTDSCSGNNNARMGLSLPNEVSPSLRRERLATLQMQRKRGLSLEQAHKSALHYGIILGGRGLNSAVGVSTRNLQG